MARIGFMNRQNLQHVPVVFLEKTLHAFFVPIRWRRTDGVEADGIGIERWRRFEIGQCIASLELGHLDYLTAVRIRQAQDIPFANESLNTINRRSSVLDQIFGSAMLLV